MAEIFIGNKVDDPPKIAGRYTLQDAKKALKLSNEEYKNCIMNISQLAVEKGNSEKLAECFDDFAANKNKANEFSKTVVNITLEYLVKTLKGEKLW